VYSLSSSTNYVNFQDLKVRCKTARQGLEVKILAAVSHVPSHQTSSFLRFSLRRSGNLEPQIATRDLARCSTSPETLKEFNPSLTPNDINYIHGEILHWLELCVLEDKLERMVIMAQSRNHLDLERELKDIDRTWDIRKFPSWLLFEAEQR
jgi:hypothetical protein